MNSKNEKRFPLIKSQLDEIVKKFPTPFIIYDEKAIRDNVRRFNKAFSVMPSFKEYFAVKALPNPHILQILKEEGCGTDCSSLPELILSKAVGLKDSEVMFTSNDTPSSEYEYANKIKAIINLDDITHIDFLKDALGSMPELLCFRYNPGPLKEGNAIIGKPEEAKYGLTREQIFLAFEKVKKLGVKRFGLHTMVASNELSNDYFVETATILFELAVELKEKLDIKLEFVNISGGMGIPYKLDQQPVDYEYIAQNIKKQYDKIIVPAGLDPLSLFTECARVITGPYGYLVSTAIHEKHIYREYIGLDSFMADFMRPGVYGSWQYMSVVGKENAPCNHVYDVTGSLCENCDKFAVQRELPKIDIGDYVVLHDAGAHGRAMGFNYN